MSSMRRTTLSARAGPDRLQGEGLHIQLGVGRREHAGQVGGLRQWTRRLFRRLHGHRGRFLGQRGQFRCQRGRPLQQRGRRDQRDPSDQRNDEHPLEGVDQLTPDGRDPPPFSARRDWQVPVVIHIPR